MSYFTRKPGKQKEYFAVRRSELHWLLRSACWISYLPIHNVLQFIEKNFVGCIIILWNLWQKPINMSCPSATLQLALSFLECFVKMFLGTVLLWAIFHVKIVLCFCEVGMWPVQNCFTYEGLALPDVCYWAITRTAEVNAHPACLRLKPWGPVSLLLNLVKRLAAVGAGLRTKTLLRQKSE